MRRSVSCAVAGLLIVAPLLWLFDHEPDWLPRKVVIVATLFMSIAGIMWLYDELQDIRGVRK
jgi:apolipoprotein N-acyltransferase